MLDNSSVWLTISVGRTSGCKPKGLGLGSCLTLTLHFKSKNLSVLSIDISNLSINMSLISASQFLINLKKNAGEATDKENVPNLRVEVNEKFRVASGRTRTC